MEDLYTVGSAQHPAKDDPSFPTEAEARTHAERLSMDGDTVYAVWEFPSDHDAPYTAYLYYQGECFKNMY